MQYPHAIHNWGVFGADDEIGTLNYLTADAVLRGIAAAAGAKSISSACR